MITIFLAWFDFLALLFLLRLQVVALREKGHK